MTDYQCGSCSYGSDDLDDLRQHSIQTGHVSAGPTEGKSGKGRVVAGIGIGLLTLATGAVAWNYKTLQYKALQSLAAGLVAQVAELATENEYLKSASGAGKTLYGYRNR
ncbi:hypothetical protein [Streptomyces sp. NBC_01353]|uniref:hypothetical protein n=1 Tax=Streptomyces sp. NBC_01353 TaxID=2903835 RepID=UPI002E334C84|nr:hypothetical protein [Streptomyces sp. NBC_01353]